MGLAGLLASLALAMAKRERLWEPDALALKLTIKQGPDRNCVFFVVTIGARHAVPLREHAPGQHFSNGSATERTNGRWYWPTSEAIHRLGLLAANRGRRHEASAAPHRSLANVTSRPLIFSNEGAPLVDDGGNVVAAYQHSPYFVHSVPCGAEPGEPLATVFHGLLIGFDFLRSKLSRNSPIRATASFCAGTCTRDCITSTRAFSAV